MPKRVVVVDDDNDILQIIKYVLEEQKISVKAVNDVVSFQGIINGQPELILWMTGLVTDEAANYVKNQGRSESHKLTCNIGICGK